MLNDGNIYFEEKEGVVKSCKWYDFPPQWIYDLLQKAKPELAGKRKVLDADIAWLKVILSARWSLKAVRVSKNYVWQ